MPRVRARRGGDRVRDPLPPTGVTTWEASMQLLAGPGSDRPAPSFVTCWAAVATWANLMTSLRTVVCVPLALTSVLGPGAADAPAVAGPRPVPRAVHDGGRRAVTVVPALARPQPELLLLRRPDRLAVEPVTAGEGGEHLRCGARRPRRPAVGGADNCSYATTAQAVVRVAGARRPRPLAG